MESQQPGLEFMLSYIRSVLEKRPAELEDVIARMSKTVALSLLSDKAAVDGRLVEKYFAMLSKIANIASLFTLEQSEVLKKMKESIVNLLAGLALNRNGGCVFIKALHEVQLPGKRVKLSKGSITCVEPFQAVLLEVGGLIEILLIGRLPELGKGGDSKA
ncbi:MAG TPA: hypothetical protein EYH59_05955 [Pyrodictium sp.]|nr:hypothetical protein [Pyrodictium sp.]